MKERLMQLDGLKGLFILLVVLYHYYTNTGCDINSIPFKGLEEMFVYGYLGVEFFFMVSGFLIAYSYKEKIQEYTLFEFIKRRFRYLFFVVMVAVLVDMFLIHLDNVLLSGSIYGGKSINLYTLFLSLSFIFVGWIEIGSPYANVTWFIHVLLLCYIVYYFISALSKNQKNRYIYMCVCMVLIGWIGVYKQTLIPFFYESSSRGYLCFFGGVLLFEINKICQQKNKKMVNYVLNTCMFFFVVFSIMSLMYGVEYVYGNFPMFFSLIIAPVLILSSLNLDWLKKFLLIRPIQWIGKRSTAIYLSHFNILCVSNIMSRYFEFNLKYDDCFIFFMLMVLIILTAELWYIFIENKFSRWISNKISYLLNHQ